ncbi:phosphatase PAP2 family protein [Longimicrobium sp.]|jgi:hypothetical protein|uniref:phosphatase PAP2 family protein n=1 Tax=Longimicrobium sp. TaxID=2029185 RepID=UPI002F95D83D
MTEEEDGKREYALPGPQVEPAASYWLECPVPRVITLAELTARTDVPGTADYFPPWTESVRRDCAADESQDLAELRRLAGLIDDPDAIDTEEPCRERLPISYFLQLRPPPPGAVVRPARQSDPLIETPRELARYFEAETPGLAHRHALSYLMPMTDWSPPRQGLVWAALDVAIESALLAAWYYKWRSPRPFTARRPRPVEVDPSIPVLYDREVAFDLKGEVIDGCGRVCPLPSPGTPRHPSYPSGHSTYGAAASELLSWFFPEWRRDFDELADNSGLARLWAGIHYRTDHEAGMSLGRTVARLVIEQIVASGILRCPDRTPCQEASGRRPPTAAELDREAAGFRERCGANPEQPPCDGTRPSGSEGARRGRSPQQGAV